MNIRKFNDERIQNLLWRNANSENKTEAKRGSLNPREIGGPHRGG
jgi:hypothetical protein